jgi:hypothetical protein
MNVSVQDAPKSSLKTNPVTKEKLSDFERRILKSVGHLVVQPKYENRLLKTRSDGTKVYSYEQVGKVYTIFDDGNYVMRDITVQKQKWIMPDLTKYIKPKRNDIHRQMDLDILDLVDSMATPTRRLLMKQFRLDKSENELYTDLKNLSPALKRRIDSLIEGRYLEEEYSPKYKKKVLVKSKFKYV